MTVVVRTKVTGRSAVAAPARTAELVADEALVLSHSFGAQALDECYAVDLHALNLRSCCEVLAHCRSLRVALLQENQLLKRDLEFITYCSHLLKLDLSSNRLQILPGASAWMRMSQLRILLLHNNELNSWSTVEDVSSTPNLQYLTMYRNPLVSQPAYRPFLVNKMTSLMVLDVYAVTDEERLEHVAPRNRFSARQSHMAYVPPEVQEGSTPLEIYTAEIREVVRIFQRNSPSIHIQKCFRGSLVRLWLASSLSQRHSAATAIQRVFRGFLLKVQVKRELTELLRETHEEDLLLSAAEIYRWDAARQIQRWWRPTWDRLKESRRRYRAAVRLQSLVRGTQVRSGALYSLLDFERNRKVYISKWQLEELAPLLGKALCAEKFDPESSPPLSSSIKTIRWHDSEETIYNINSINPFSGLDKRCTLRRVQNVRKNTPWGTGVQRLIINSRILKRRKVLQILKIRRPVPLRRHIQRFLANCPGHREEINDYDDLIEFDCPNAYVLKRLTTLVLQYNKDALDYGQQPIMILYEIYAKRAAATVSIQSAWRAYLTRKKLRPTIAERVVVWRAVICVQRWWRWRKLTIRTMLLAELNMYLRSISDPELYIEQKSYIHLNGIEGTSRRKFIQEQTLRYTFSPDKCVLALRDSWFRRPETPFPRWLQTSCVTVTEEQGYAEMDDLNQLIHADCQTELVSYSSLWPEIAATLGEDGNRPITAWQIELGQTEQDLKFLRLRFSSLDEARKRAAILFLRTWDLRTRTYVPLVSLRAMTELEAAASIRRLWRAHKIRIWEEELFLRKAQRSALVSDGILYTPEQLQEDTRRQRQLSSMTRIESMFQPTPPERERSLTAPSPLAARAFVEPFIPTLRKVEQGPLDSSNMAIESHRVELSTHVPSTQEVANIVRLEATHLAMLRELKNLHHLKSNREKVSATLSSKPPPLLNDMSEHRTIARLQNTLDSPRYTEDKEALYRQLHDLEVQYRRKNREKVRQRRIEKNQVAAELKLEKDMNLEAIAVKTEQERKERIIEIRKHIINDQREKLSYRVGREEGRMLKKKKQNERIFANAFARQQNMINRQVVYGQLERLKENKEMQLKEKAEVYRQENRARRAAVQAILYDKFQAKRSEIHAQNATTAAALEVREQQYIERNKSIIAQKDQLRQFKAALLDIQQNSLQVLDSLTLASVSSGQGEQTAPNIPTAMSYELTLLDNLAEQARVALEATLSNQEFDTFNP
eukprot:GILJ01007807.1.p1 GENE.GILJ01007807.1~~GILJ01007807.1.p1  ORF type:complete len:1227 (-),score=171.45 GILJ01007807.1:179-3859(-)